MERGPQAPKEGTRAEAHSHIEEQMDMFERVLSPDAYSLLVALRLSNSRRELEIGVRTLNGLGVAQLNLPDSVKGAEAFEQKDIVQLAGMLVFDVDRKLKWEKKLGQPFEFSIV
ncbi:MAG TPA: hypothetical protein VEA92_02530 [Candidatus Paceibacterota bacterium]|nr:hypothetical protein [Candidatus Paceibacterota bacterium]